MGINISRIITTLWVSKRIFVNSWCFLRHCIFQAGIAGWFSMRLSSWTMTPHRSHQNGQSIDWLIDWLIGLTRLDSTLSVRTVTIWFCSLQAYLDALHHRQAPDGEATRATPLDGTAWGEQIRQQQHLLPLQYHSDENRKLDASASSYFGRFSRRQSAKCQLIRRIDHFFLEWWEIRRAQELEMALFVLNIRFFCVVGKLQFSVCVCEYIEIIMEDSRECENGIITQLLIDSFIWVRNLGVINFWGKWNETWLLQSVNQSINQSITSVDLRVPSRLLLHSGA